MSPATPWAELTGTAPNWTQGFTAPGSGTLSGVIIHGVALPLTNYTAWVDVNTTYTELSITATPATELVGVLTTYTELTL